MEREIRELTKVMAENATQTKTLTENVQSIFRTLNGSSGQDGLNTRVSVLQNDLNAAFTKIASMEEEQKHAARGKIKVTIAIITGILGFITAIGLAIISALFS